MAYRPYGKPTAAYSSVPRSGSPTHTEAWALTEAARRMAVAVAAYDQDRTKDNLNKIRDAVRLNWRLWTIFQAELTAERASVPADLRISMLTLCQFVDTHTVSLLGDTRPEKVLTLVEINRNIASGLLEGMQKSVEAAKSEAAQPKETKAAAAPPPSVNEVT